MVDPKAVAVAVSGALLAVVGGLGTVVYLIGTLLGAMEWSIVGWLLLLAFVGGSGLLTYGIVVLLGDVADVAGEGIGGLTDGAGVRQLLEMLD